MLFKLNDYLRKVYEKENHWLSASDFFYAMIFVIVKFDISCK